MNIPSINEVLPEPLNKGKGRAQPSEHTPLLHDAPSSSYTEGGAIAPETSDRRLRSKLTFVFLISFCICIIFFAILALLAWSYAAKVSRTPPDVILQDAVVFRGPDYVNILNTTSEGEIWLRVGARLGVDAGSIVGVNTNSDKDNFFQEIWKSAGRWGIERLGKVSVKLSHLTIASQHDPSVPLMTMDAQPVVVHLTTNPPPDDSWLTNISVVFLVRPTNDTSASLHFLRHSWRQGFVAVCAEARRVALRGGSDGANWRSMFSLELSNVRTSMRMPIPQMPGLPRPGHDVPFPSISDLLTLKSFSVSNKSDNLSLRATASIVDPVPLNFNLTSPSLPFIVSLVPPSNHSISSTIPVASVSTAPFTLTHPNITLDISGTVLPFGPEASDILSYFITRYLSGKPNSILVTSPVIPGLSVQAVFPGPNPRPQVLRNVTIQDMKVKPGTQFLASGTVYARIVLPAGMDVELNASRVFPDVLVFDGQVPDETDVLPPSTPLPDPLPPRAFGHIRPDDWLDSLCSREESGEGEGSVYTVTAKIVDVPLEVLPGRQKQFSNFISKVIFNPDGAVAGILGTAAVAVSVQGLPLPGEGGEMELTGLPFQGSLRIGKKTLLAGGGTWRRLKHLFGFHDHNTRVRPGIMTLLPQV